MGTKRYISLLLGLLMMFTLTACDGGKDKDQETEGDMTIQPALLSEEENALLELLGVEMGNYRIFDFQLKENSGVQSMGTTVYELVDGDWKPIAQEHKAFTDPEGRIALTVGKVTDGVTTSVQSASSGGSSTYVPTLEEDVSGMAFATSKLSGSASIELDREIPLMLQVATAKSEFTTYEVDYFGMPRELAKHGYEHVYAVTVMFSEKTVAQLDQDAPTSEPSPAE